MQSKKSRYWIVKTKKRSKRFIFYTSYLGYRRKTEHLQQVIEKLRTEFVLTAEKYTNEKSSLDLKNKELLQAIDQERKENEERITKMNSEYNSLRKENDALTDIIRKVNKFIFSKQSKLICSSNTDTRKTY